MTPPPLEGALLEGAALSEAWLLRDVSVTLRFPSGVEYTVSTDADDDYYCAEWAKLVVALKRKGKLCR